MGKQTWSYELGRGHIFLCSCNSRIKREKKLFTYCSELSFHVLKLVSLMFVSCWASRTNFSYRARHLCLMFKTCLSKNCRNSVRKEDFLKINTLSVKGLKTRMKETEDFSVHTNATSHSHRFPF